MALSGTTEDEDGFGDEFDDFEEGQEGGDDFGEFDDGLQDDGLMEGVDEEASSPLAVATPLPPIVRIAFHFTNCLYMCADVKANWLEAFIRLE